MNTTGKTKSDLHTPCLILDLDVLERNLEKMHRAVTGAGKNMRPHAKSHKCSALVREQMEAGAIGVCVAKLTEADALIKAGIRDLLITGPVVTPGKIELLIGLLSEAPNLMIVVDHQNNIAMLDSMMGSQGEKMDVLLDLDVGLHRTGVKPSKAMAVAEQIIACPNLRLRGIQAYAGQLQHISSYDKRKNESLECLQAAVQVFRELRKKVSSCTIFSTSGTGTFDIDIAIPEISELQVGSYVLMDAEYLGIGSAGNDSRNVSFDPALRLLTTVISANQYNFVTVDAGLKTLYRDGGTPEVIRPESSALVYDWFGDEYGKITGSDPSGLPQLGAVLELVVSHCDPTVNLFDSYFLTRGDDVVGTWPIDLRGCSQ